MAKTLKRSAAFAALTRALMAGARSGPSVGTRLAALLRMIRATATGKYDGGLRLALMAAATAYIVSPIDLIPEIPLGLLGLVDDAVMVSWLAGSVLAETDRFLEWEARRSSVIPGHVVP